MNVRGDMEKWKRELDIEKERNMRMERNVKELESTLCQLQARKDEQDVIIQNWEREEREEKAKEEMKREIREKIEYEGFVRDEVKTKKRRAAGY